MSDELRQLRDQTKARPDAVARVKARTTGELTPADVKALLRAVPGAPEGAAARIKANVAHLSPRAPRPWARPWARAGSVAAFLGAAFLGVGLLGGGVVGVGLLDGDTPSFVPDAILPGPLRSDAPVSLDLADGQRVVVGDLTVDAAGHGALSGTRAAPVLRWREGRARLVADDLFVATREAEARVGGQALAVARDPTGTTVAVERGTLEVRCLADGAVHTVAARDATAATASSATARATITCPPVSAEGMLGRARHERATGLSARDVLATVDAGLARPSATPVARAELAVLRMQLLAELGRPAEALAAARAHLAGTAPTGTSALAHTADPHPTGASSTGGADLRRDEVQRFAAALALTLEGCAGALPHLHALAPTSLDAALRLAACAPDRAADVLDAAAPLALTPEDRQALATTRSLLGVH